MDNTERIEIAKKARDRFFEIVDAAFRSKLEAHADDPSPVHKPNLGVDHSHVRILPVRAERCPRRLWQDKWCFYEIAVGQNGGGGLETGTCAFVWPPNQKASGGGGYRSAISPILKEAAAASKERFSILHLGGSELLRYSFRGHPDPNEMAAQLKWLVEHTLNTIQAVPSIQAP